MTASPALARRGGGSRVPVFPFGSDRGTGICRPVDRRVTQRQMLRRMVPEQAAASPMFTELIAASDVIIGETLMAKGLGG